MLPVRDKMYAFGVIYVTVSIVVIAVINYYTWRKDPADYTVFTYLFWGSLYVPLFIFYKAADWKISEFGFVVNKKVGLIVLLSAVLLGYSFIKGSMTGGWHSSLTEAFARTGEEVYFRGFVYVLVLKVFQHKKNPWRWAVLLSSIIFTLPHTQTLLTGYGTSIFQIFLFALFLAYLRHLTDSILPAVTFHTFLKGGVYSVLFGWAIYGLFVFWSHYKGEKTE